VCRPFVCALLLGVSVFGSSTAVAHSVRAAVAPDTRTNGAGVVKGRHFATVDAVVFFGGGSLYSVILSESRQTCGGFRRLLKLPNSRLVIIDLWPKYRSPGVIPTRGLPTLGTQQTGYVVFQDGQIFGEANYDTDRSHVVLTARAFGTTWRGSAAIPETAVAGHPYRFAGTFDARWCGKA
jgi:hypothetical protein